MGAQQTGRPEGSILIARQSSLLTETDLLDASRMIPAGTTSAPKTDRLDGSVRIAESAPQAETGVLCVCGLIPAETMGSRKSADVDVSFQIPASHVGPGGDSSLFEIPTVDNNDHLVVEGDSVSETSIVAQTEPVHLSPPFAASATQAVIPLPSTAPFTPSDVLLNDAVEVLSFSVETLSASITVSESLEETVDSAGSRIVIVHTFSVHVAIPIYTRVRSSIIPLRLVLESEPSENSIDSGVLIGGAGGGAAIIALLTGAAIFIVRSRAKADMQFGGDADTITRTESTSVLEPSSITVEDATPADPLDNNYVDTVEDLAYDDGQDALFI
jgi:hypothetical protein